MALVVETGAIITGADTYVTRAAYIAHAATRGITVADATAADTELVKAAEFIGTYEQRLKGYRVTREQPLAFPRYDVVIEGFSWASIEIPRQVILCQLAVALDIHAGIDPYNPPANPNQAVRSKRVEGAVTVEYFGTDGGAKMSRESSASALIACLLKNSGLTLVRA